MSHTSAPKSRRPRDIGTSAETAVVRYLRDHGWPYAERRALHGSADLGDITGTPGVCWEVKGGDAAAKASDGQVSDWLAETETERRNAGAEVGILVVRRAGIGPANAGRWWAIVPLECFVTLSGARGLDPAPPPMLNAAPVRLLLADAVALLRHDGWGDEPTERCDHIWPAELDGAHCERCGLAYAEYDQ